jgi:hypothetical protein
MLLDSVQMHGIFSSPHAERSGQSVYVIVPHPSAGCAVEHSLRVHLRSRRSGANSRHRAMRFALLVPSTDAGQQHKIASRTARNLTTSLK